MRKSGRFALALSFALHLCVLALLLRVPAPAATRFAPANSVELDVNYLAPTPVPQEPARAPPRPEAARPRPTGSRATAAVRPSEPEHPLVAAESEGKGSSSGETSATPGEPVGGSPEAGEPQVAKLDLSISTKTGDWALQAGASQSRHRGETWRNEPGGFPDPAAQRAADVALGKKNVEGWLNDAVAEKRVQNGAVDPYFFKVSDSLEKRAAQDANRLLSGDAKKDFVMAWQEGAKTYAKTGNPYAPGTLPDAAPAIDGDTPLNRAAEQFTDSGLSQKGGFSRVEGLITGGVGAGGMKMRQEMGRSLRDFADGKFSPGLLALVELRQGLDGKLLELSLRQPSGNVAFDAHVMRSAPQAISELPLPPQSGGGIHPDGLHSLWSFQGKIVYKRKMRDMNLLRDGWYMALLAATGLATSSFDETTGDMEVPDFRHPEFQLKVKLLKVY